MAEGSAWFKADGGKGDGVSRHRTVGEYVMSACPRDSSNTELSSRLSGTCLLCRPFSCPPPRTLEREKKTKTKRGKGAGGKKSRARKWVDKVI